MFTYEFPRPSVTADIVLFDLSGTHVLLIQRGNDPFKDCWAFPGGFFDMEDYDIEQTAMRELQEETGLTNIPLSLVCVASRKGRDPRGRTVTAVFSARIDPADVSPQGADDAKEARWFPISQLPPLAFDHSEILQKILNQ